MTEKGLYYYIQVNIAVHYKNLFGATEYVSVNTPVYMYKGIQFIQPHIIKIVHFKIVSIINGLLTSVFLTFDPFFRRWNFLAAAAKLKTA